MNNQTQNWTEEIKSNSSLLSVNVQEIWHYRDLIYMLVKRDFITFYKQTILGPIWFFVQPILTSVIYLVLFGQVAKLSTDGLPQLAFYLSGITIWNYFSESLSKTSTVFKDNSGVFGKVYFPRLIMPLAIVVSGLMKFSIQFALFISVVLYYTFVQQTIAPNIWVLATPYLILLMAAFALGLGMIFSSLTTKYKDLICRVPGHHHLRYAGLTACERYREKAQSLGDRGQYLGLRLAVPAPCARGRHLHHRNYEIHWWTLRLDDGCLRCERARLAFVAPGCA